MLYDPGYLFYGTKHKKSEGDKYRIILSALLFPNPNLNPSLWICLMEPDIKLFIPPTRKNHHKIYWHLNVCMSVCLFSWYMNMCQVLIWYWTHTRTYSYTNNRHKMNTLSYIFSVKDEFSQNVFMPHESIYENQEHWHFKQGN